MAGQVLSASSSAANQLDSAVSSTEVRLTEGSSPGRAREETARLNSLTDSAARVPFRLPPAALQGNVLDPVKRLIDRWQGTTDKWSHMAYVVRRAAEGLRRSAEAAAAAQGPGPAPQPAPLGRGRQGRPFAPPAHAVAEPQHPALPWRTAHGPVPALASTPQQHASPRLPVQLWMCAWGVVALLVLMLALGVWLNWPLLLLSAAFLLLALVLASQVTVRRTRRGAAWHGADAPPRTVSQARVALRVGSRPSRRAEPPARWPAMMHAQVMAGALAFGMSVLRDGCTNLEPLAMREFVTVRLAPPAPSCPAPPAAGRVT